MFSSKAIFFFFFVSAKTSSMFTSASISERWISFIIPSTSFLSRKIAFVIFVIPVLSAFPSFSNTMKCEGLLGFNVFWFCLRFYLYTIAQ